MKRRKKRRRKLKTRVGLTLRGKVVVFFVLFIIVLLTTIILLLTLPQFLLKEVNINNLVKVEEKEILDKANFELDKNIFLQGYIKAEKQIEAIKMVKNVDIRFKLPSTINLDVQERIETYQIKSGDIYSVIDEQGYFLKTMDKKSNIPLITGVQAKFDNEVRLEEEELRNLEDINKIYNTTKILNIDGMISEINLEDKGFSINFASNKKKAHFENTNNLMNSMQFVREILCSEEIRNKSGDIYATEESARFKPK